MPDTNTEGPPATDKLSRVTMVTMIVVLVVMALVALHLNWIRWHRDQIEKVIVTPIERSPSPAP